MYCSSGVATTKSVPGAITPLTVKRKRTGQWGMLRGQRDVPPARPVGVSLHHHRHPLGGELCVGVKGHHDIPAMDAYLGNEVVEDRPHGLGTVGPVTQRLPVVGPHLLESVLDRPGAGDKGRQQVGPKLVTQRQDPLRQGCRIDALAGATRQPLRRDAPDVPTSTLDFTFLIR